MYSFVTQYDPHDRVYSNPGSPVRTVYQAEYDPVGILRIAAAGEEDLYGYIQSHRDSVDIHVILRRFAEGDKDALSHAQGFYADVSGMPQTYAEVLNAVLAGERAFDSLPAEVKAKFGNSYSHWLASMDAPDFGVRMGWTDTRPDSVKLDDVSPASAPIPSEEVLPNDT